MLVARVAVLASTLWVVCQVALAAGPLDQCKGLKTARATAECVTKLISSDELGEWDLYHALIVRADLNRLYDGDPNERISDLGRAIELRPDVPEPYNSRGIAYADLKRYQEAIDDYTRYISLLPEEGMHDDGIGVPKEASLLRAWGYGNSCIAYREWGKLAEALSHCDRALKLARYPAGFEARAAVRFALKEYDLAIKDYTTAIKTFISIHASDEHAASYLGRAEAYEAQGNRKKALADAQKAQELVEKLDDDEKKDLQELLARLKAGNPKANQTKQGQGAAATKRQEPPLENAPRVVHTKGYNGTVYVKGTFTRTKNGTWEERNSQNGDAVQTFRALKSEKNKLLLFDESRNIYLSIDFVKKRLSWRAGPNGNWNKLYDIIRLEY